MFSDALNKNADTHRIHYCYKLPKNRLTVINTQQKFWASQRGDDHTGQYFAHLWIVWFLWCNVLNNS